MQPMETSTSPPAPAQAHHHHLSPSAVAHQPHGGRGPTAVDPHKPFIMGSGGPPGAQAHHASPGGSHAAWQAQSDPNQMQLGGGVQLGSAALSQPNTMPLSAAPQHAAPAQAMAGAGGPPVTAAGGAAADLQPQQLLHALPQQAQQQPHQQQQPLAAAHALPVMSIAALQQQQQLLFQQQQQQQHLAQLPPPQPRRALTKPSEGVKNEGYDNENSDLILRVGDSLINHNPGQSVLRKYIIQGMLGQGTFGQVVSCWSNEMQRNVAVKVIKNQPAYFHQARVEIGVLNLLNSRCDPLDERHIVRMLDSFLFRKHLCIVFEKLDVNLFELLKRNAFKGLSLPTVQSLLRQLLDSLSVLRDAAIMHCDVKPENILLKSVGSDAIKLIDFGSACFENRVVYSYIQSRFYRSPEVVLGMSYNVAIDVWSLGCVAAELFLGLPLFPGASEHDLIVRIVETLGFPPDWLMHEAKHTERFFKRMPLLAAAQQLPIIASPSVLASSLGGGGGLGPYDLASSVPRHQHQHLAQLAAQQQQRQTAAAASMSASVGSSGASPAPAPAMVTQWVLLTQPEFEARNQCKAPVGKRYFAHTKLADIIAAYPMKVGLQDEERLLERRQREAFIDFLLGVLDLDPRTRWTPHQAAAHPFVTGVPFTGPFQPPPDCRLPIGVHVHARSSPAPPPPMPAAATTHHAPSTPANAAEAAAGADGSLAPPAPPPSSSQQQQPQGGGAAAAPAMGTASTSGPGGGAALASTDESATGVEGPTAPSQHLQRTGSTSAATSGPYVQPMQLQGSLHTSFILGTPHKRAAVARASPTLRALPGAAAAGSTGPPLQQQGRGGLAMAMTGPAAGAGGVPRTASQQDEHLQPEAAAQGLALAALQQATHVGGYVTTGPAGLPSVPTHPYAAVAGAGADAMDFQSARAEEPPTASVPAAPGITLGSTPSTLGLYMPLPPPPPPPPPLLGSQGVMPAAAAPAQAQAAAFLQQQLALAQLDNATAAALASLQGSVAGGMAPDVRNVASLAAAVAVRQALAQLQRQQDSLAVAALAHGLSPQQLALGVPPAAATPQQLQAAFAALAHAAGTGTLDAGGGAAGAHRGLPAAAGSAMAGGAGALQPGSLPMAAAAATAAVTAAAAALGQPLAWPGSAVPLGLGQAGAAGYGGWPQYPQNPGSQLHSAPAPATPAAAVTPPADVHQDPQSASGAPAAGLAAAPAMAERSSSGGSGGRSDSPADWDPLYNEMDLVDVPPNHYASPHQHNLPPGSMAGLPGHPLMPSVTLPDPVAQQQQQALLMQVHQEGLAGGGASLALAALTAMQHAQQHGAPQAPGGAMLPLDTLAQLLNPAWVQQQQQVLAGAGMLAAAQRRPTMLNPTLAPGGGEDAMVAAGQLVGSLPSSGMGAGTPVHMHQLVVAAQQRLQQRQQQQPEGGGPAGGDGGGAPDHGPMEHSS